MVLFDKEILRPNIFQLKFSAFSFVVAFNSKKRSFFSNQYSFVNPTIVVKQKRTSIYPDASEVKGHKSPPVDKTLVVGGGVELGGLISKAYSEQTTWNHARSTICRMCPAAGESRTSLAGERVSSLLRREGWRTEEGRRAAPLICGSRLNYRTWLHPSISSYLVTRRDQNFPLISLSLSLSLPKQTVYSIRVYSDTNLIHCFGLFNFADDEDFTFSPSGLIRVREGKDGARKKW